VLIGIQRPRRAPRPPDRRGNPGERGRRGPGRCPGHHLLRTTSPLSRSSPSSRARPLASTSRADRGPGGRRLVPGSHDRRRDGRLDPTSAGRRRSASPSWWDRGPPRAPDPRGPRGAKETCRRSREGIVKVLLEETDGEDAVEIERPWPSGVGRDRRMTAEADRPVRRPPVPCPGITGTCWTSHLTAGGHRPRHADHGRDARILAARSKEALRGTSVTILFLTRRPTRNPGQLRVAAKTSPPTW